jgi:XrtN system VIT domain protein
MEQEQNAFEQDFQNAVNESPNEPQNEQAEQIPHIFNPLKQGSTIVGLVLVVVSFLCFVFTITTPSLNGNMLENPLFYITHAGVIFFCFKAMFSYKQETAWYPTRINATFLWLVAFQIGAFMLNLDMKAFPESTGWLQVALTVHCLTMIALTFRDLMSEKTLNALFFIMGIGLILDLYFVAFTLYFAVVTTLLVWFFGLTFYLWSPFFKVVYSLNFLSKSIHHGRHFGKYYAGGVAFALSMVLFFNLAWFNLVGKTNAAISDTKSALPEWVRIAQVLPPSVLTEKLLKSDIRGGSLMFGFEGIGDRWHDPLVVLGNAIMPMPAINFDDRSKALKAIFNERKDAERRLWNGDNLRTSNVDIAVEMLPKQRIAYTEQTLTIENSISEDARWATQEAIYIFKLPEGGVVTSLSLWINGKEEKGYLTSQHKADSAYTTIVGRENRDPSMVHWREGNTVSVRVFPCTPQEVRKVKIGFTTPLRLENNQLFYDNILFEGSPALSAKTHTYIYGVDKLASEALDFEKKDKSLAYEGRYKNEGWSCALDCPPLSQDVFSYEDRTYHVSAYTPQYEVFEPTEIYLDINKSWNTDFDEIWAKVKNKTVYAFYKNNFILLNESNVKEVSEALMGYNFSVFPIEKISHFDKALVITQSTSYTPDLSDLGDRVSFERGNNYKNIRVFSRGSTTYWNTLKQLRIARIQQGTLSDLDKILTQKVFLKDEETDGKVVIEPSKVIITQDSIRSENKATDHLFRLWAYNIVLSNYAHSNAEKGLNTEGGVQLAEKANIVTPVSSLIVLEKQEDYDRFDIKKNGNALGNAALNNSGAAPEPHEWALIVLGFGIVLWTIRRRFFSFV